MIATDKYHHYPQNECKKTWRLFLNVLYLGNNDLVGDSRNIKKQGK